eukprot:1468802-Amphidinium_carterae.2
MVSFLLCIQHHAPFSNGAASVLLRPCAAVVVSRRVVRATSVLSWRDGSFTSPSCPPFPLVVLIAHHAPSARLDLPGHIQASWCNGHRTDPARSASQQISVAQALCRIGTHGLHFDARNSSQTAQQMEALSSVSLGNFLRLGLDETVELVSVGWQLFHFYNSIALRGPSGFA